MQDHPDKNESDAGLDGLFRKSAEEFKPPYDPTAWQDMQRRLNHHDRTAFWKTWTRRILPVGLVLLLLTGSYWLIRRSVHNNSQPVVARRETAGNTLITNAPIAATGELSRNRKPVYEQTITEPVTTPAARSAENPLAEKDGLLSSKSRPAVPTAANQFAPAEKPGSAIVRLKSAPESGFGGKPVTRQRTADESPGTGQAGGIAAQSPDALHPDAVTDRRLTRNKSRLSAQRTATNGRVNLSVVTNATGRQGREPPIIDRRLLNPDYVPGADEATIPPAKTAEPSATRIDDPETPGEQRLQLGETPVLVSRPARWPIAIPLTDPIPSPSEAVRQPPLATRTRLTGLSLQLVVSPDLSAIGLHNVGNAAGNRPGTNLGLLLSYRLSNRWSLQTGVLHSLKVYKASGDDYVWPSNWKWPLWFDGVDARCAMLDVPLNVRYDVFVRPGRSAGLRDALPSARWFVSGGVTSYVILKERYDYKYDNPSDPRIQAWKWEGKTGTYGLSEMNLSVGYEKPISRRLSWQVEPFMKVPLRQVGFFKVRLISTGAFLSLRYRL